MNQLSLPSQEIPHRRVCLFGADTSLADAIRQLKRDQLDTALILEKQTLLGVLHTRDCLMAVHEQRDPVTPVRQLMSATFISLPRSGSLGAACTRLLADPDAELVITDETGVPLGVVDEGALLELATEGVNGLAHSPDPAEQGALPDMAGRKSMLPTPSTGSLSRLVGGVRNLVARADSSPRRYQVEERLRTIKRQTDLLSRFATALINLPADHSDAAVNRALREMGELAQVDRAYIFSYDFETQLAINTHEWCAEGISPQIDNLQSLPLETLADWVEPHRRGENHVVNDVASLPESTSREVLLAQDIKSIVCLPILSSAGCIGFLGFDSVRQQRSYGPEELEVLGLFARTLANYRERVDAERKLANSEANFQAFFEQIRDLAFVLSREGEIVQYNSRVCQRLGFSPSDLLGQSILQLHSESKRDEVARTLAEMARGSIDHHAIPMKTRSGETVPLEAGVVSGQWNGAPALFMVCRDLSEITSSEEKFSKAFHLSSMPMAITDLRQGIFLEVNEAFFRVTGYSIVETIGNDVFSMNLIEDPSQWRDIIRQLQQQVHVSDIELPLRTREGRTVHGLVNAALLELQGRQVMIFQLLDITARKAAEDALEDERIQLRTLINSQPNMVWLKDPDGVYLACNELFESLFARSESEIVGKTDYHFVTREKADFFRTNDRLAIEAGEPRTNEEYLDFAATGYHGLFETTKTPILNANGRLIGVLGMARDITNARQEEQKRQRIERELHQSNKMEALGQLTGGVAHEFNNMLAIIQGYKDLLEIRLGPDVDPAIGSCLEHIDVASTTATNLVRQLLGFSRPVERKCERINLEIEVRNAMILSQSSLPSSIEIDYQPGAGVPDVLLDTGDLQQILTNLLVNARDAMEGRGSIKVSLQYSSYRDQECQACHSLINGDWVELSIADDGPGIAPEQRSRIFEPFYTTKAVGKGTGLGLSLVRSTMEHNGGHILLDSGHEHGTCFRLLFPALEFKADSTPTIQLPVETPSLSAGRVLVVDDEPALTGFLQEALEMQGLQVVIANDGQQALQLLDDAEQQFDLLITDQTMPGMQGTELAAQARERRRELKVILCTGHSEQINEDNALESGIDRLLLKPVGMRDVLIAMNDLMK